MGIGAIQEAIRAGRVRITDHADEEAQADGIALAEVYFSTLNGEVIEDYPTDKPYPSCLIQGLDAKGGPVHSVWAYNEISEWAVLITVYRPDPDRWINWRERKR